PAPLDRVHDAGGTAPLRATLDRLAATARVRLSYSPDLLPLTRAVCLPAAPHTLGDALVAALEGTGAAPVVAGADLVVLAPARASAAIGAVPLLARSTGRLQRVVVTGTPGGGPARAPP
ncbi:hypothetical protein PYV61_03280, partial [Roseisolibacter sp. H3M3-2]